MFIPKQKIRVPTFAETLTVFVGVDGVEPPTLCL